MTDFPVTLAVPAEIYERAQQLADQRAVSIEQVLLEQLETTLIDQPPALPLEEQAELDALEHLSDQILLAILRAPMPDDQRQRMELLMVQNNFGTISPSDREELTWLVEECQRSMLLKAKALSLLTVRGYETEMILNSVEEKKIAFDTGKVELALQKLSDALSERPQWIILLSRNGEFIARIGDFINVPPPPIEPLLETQTIVSAIRTQALQEIELLDKSEHGTFQYSIHAGGDGIFFIYHLNDTYLLGISYQRLGVQSIDAVIDSVRFQELLETLYRLTLTS